MVKNSSSNRVLVSFHFLFFIFLEVYTVVIKILHIFFEIVTSDHSHGSKSLGFYFAFCNEKGSLCTSGLTKFPHCSTEPAVHLLSRFYIWRRIHLLDKITHCSSQIEVGFECCMPNKENEFYYFHKDNDFLQRRTQCLAISPLWLPPSPPPPHSSFCKSKSISVKRELIFLGAWEWVKLRGAPHQGLWLIHSWAHQGQLKGRTPLSTEENPLIPAWCVLELAHPLGGKCTCGLPDWSQREGWVQDV